MMIASRAAARFRPGRVLAVTFGDALLITAGLGALCAAVVLRITHARSAGKAATAEDR